MTHTLSFDARTSVAVGTSPRLLLPTALLPGERYYLWSEDGTSVSQDVRELLQWASPHAQCVGVGCTPPSLVTLVLTQPDGWQRGRQLAASGAVDPGRILVMPLPFGYPWAFWDTWQLFRSRPELLSQLYSFEAFRHFFCASYYLGGPDNIARLTDWNALARTAFYWEPERPLLDAHRAELGAVRDALFDADSRDVLDLVVASDPHQLWRHYISTVFSATDYLDDDAPEPGEHVLNLGVFTGHEVPYLTALVGESGSVHCIDPVGCDLLSPYARAHIASTSTLVIEARVAAGASRGTASFRSYPDGQVCLDANAGTAHTFDTLTLDEYAQEIGMRSVDFVKIDVEGMEWEVLDGMSNILARHRPTVSIAIYHQADHLWRIPQRLMNTLDGYRFHLTHCSPVRWETVLTAVPAERPFRGLRHR